VSRYRRYALQGTINESVRKGQIPLSITLSHGLVPTATCR